jgi:pyruvate/2-oxoglutarate dehydrogenase complex dihydrolipoamide acyltransferase (E2) component
MADGEGKEARPQTWLLGGALTALTTILAALGAVELGMDRMLRNHPELVFVAFGLVVIAAVLGGIALTLEATAPKPADPAPAAPAPAAPAPAAPAPAAPAPAPAAPAPAPAAPASAVLRTSRRLLIAGLVCFAFAGIFAVLAAVRTPADDEFPSIAAGFKSGERPALTVSIKGAGLTSTEDLDVHIEGASGRDPKVEPIIQRLYTTRLGPSPSGHVDSSVEVPMTPGAYDRVIIKAWVN